MGNGMQGGTLTGGAVPAPSLQPGATGTDLTLSGTLAVQGQIAGNADVSISGSISSTANISADNIIQGGSLYSTYDFRVGPTTIPSAAAGDATINQSRGLAGVANTFNVVTITNNIVTADSVVLIEWQDDPGALRWWVLLAAGAFQLNLSGPVVGDKFFRFVVVS